MVFACQGRVGGGGPENSEAPHEGGQSEAGEQSGGGGMIGAPLPPDVGTTPLHRLNGVELFNTVDAVLGRDAANLLPKVKDPLVEALDSNADALGVSPSAVDSMFATASVIAQQVKPEAFGTCAAPAEERACAKQQIERMSLLLLRRPPLFEDVAAALRLWDEVRAREPANMATRAVVQRLLLAPEFLYHVELGDPDTGRLDNYEMASRLSYLAWEGPPDDELYKAAAAGSLVTKEGARAQLRRMLASPKGKATFLRFFALWTDLPKLEEVTKDPSAYPAFEAVRPSMRKEFDHFVSNLMNGSGTLADLLTSRQTFADAPLASLYGLAAPELPFASVTLPPARGGGILTQSAFLSVHGHADGSAPILRGIFVRERLLCAPVPPPPPGVSAAGPAQPESAKSTTRAYVSALTADAACQGCHGSINPLGFAFEHFGGAGEFRAQERGAPIDASVDLVGSEAKQDAYEGRFEGAPSLLARLAQTEAVRTCLARFWFRSRFRRLETGPDEHVIEAMAAAFRDGGDRLDALAASLADQEALRLAHFRVEESP